MRKGRRTDTHGEEGDTPSDEGGRPGQEKDIVGVEWVSRKEKEGTSVSCARLCWLACLKSGRATERRLTEGELSSHGVVEGGL
jgi:hypothetical protein